MLFLTSKGSKWIVQIIGADRRHNKAHLVNKYDIDTVMSRH